MNKRIWGLLPMAFVISGFIAILVSATSSAALASSCQDLFQPASADILASRSPSDRELKTRTPASPKPQERVQKFVKIREGRELWVDFLKPAPGQPVAVLVNGLTYRTGVWDSFVKKLEGDGLGILRYDPRGMGETMKKDGLPSEAIQIVDQVKDLNSLLNNLGIRNPHLAGLSYGAGIVLAYGATYPNKIASLILKAPLTGPLPKLEADIQLKINATRAMFPLNPATDVELYNFFLRQIVFMTYPLSEPIVLEHPYKLENVFRMTQGTVGFRASDYVDRLPKGKVHLIVADRDQYIPPEILDVFWNSIPKDARASRLFLQHSEHKIPEAMPGFSAEWIKLIINGDSRLQDGGTWVGGVWSGGVDGGTTRIDIPQK